MSAPDTVSLRRSSLLKNNTTCQFKIKCYTLRENTNISESLIQILTFLVVHQEVMHADHSYGALNCP